MIPHGANRETRKEANVPKDVTREQQIFGSISRPVWPNESKWMSFHAFGWTPQQLGEVAAFR
jgi:hypothetical protein